MEEYKQYIKNVNIIRNLSKLIIEDTDTRQTIIEKIRNNAKESYNYKTFNDEFLDRVLYKKDVKDITKEEANELLAFSKETFNFADSLDIGVSFKIFEKLLDYAKYNNDTDLYIKSLYYCGMGLFYLNTKDEENGHALFKDKITAYFNEGASYLNKFKDFDSDTRQYIIRCLGNRKACIERQTLKGVSEYYKIYDETMDVINSKEYRDIDPSLKWDNFIYGMKMDELSLIDYIRKNDDPIVANKVLEAAEYVYSKNIKDDETRLQNWRIDYYYCAALCFNHKISNKEFIDRLIEIASNANKNDYSMAGVNKNLTTKTFLLFNINKLLDDKQKEELAPLISSLLKDIYKYLDNLPGENTKHSVTNAVRDLVGIQSELTVNDKQDMLNYLVAFHKPTYVHSLMVAELTKTLTASLLMNNPESLLGVLNYNSKSELLSHADQILDLAYNCGIYHDIGKNMVMSFININERRLIDEEFKCIQTHPESGFRLLAKNKDNECYALAALYHHVYYNGEGGYPKNIEKCPSFIKPIVDVLSIADAIDAATDSIGRHYKYPKTLDALIEEFKQGSGIRYAPFVVDLFNNQDVRKRIDTIINVERLSIYMNVYHKGKTYTISTYQKEEK